MPVHVLYATKVTATGGRDGHVAAEDGSLDLMLTTPKELGGAGGSGNNPEQLFAAAYAACFLGAMKFVASQGGPKVPDDAKVAATVGIGYGQRAASGSTFNWTSHCRDWRRPTRIYWCSGRISPVRIRMQRETTYPCGW